MKFKRSITNWMLALLAASVLSFVGCQSPHLTVPEEPGEVAILPMRQGSVELEGILRPDGTVEPTSGRGQTVPGQAFYVRDVRSARQEEGYPRLQVTVASRSGSTTNLRYRIIWFDEDGMEVAGGGGWTPVTLAARETQQLTGVGRSTAAHSFRVFIQEMDFAR